jgi:hypothetical protein
VKKTAGRTITVFLWAVIAGGVFFGLNWAFWLWPVILMALVFIPVVFALALAIVASVKLGQFLGHKLAGWSGWDREMSELLCFLVIGVITISPVLWFLSSSVFDDWCVSAWNFGLMLPHRQVLS